MTEPNVVIVEDEALLALDLEDICRECGCRVLGTATSAAEARRKFADLDPMVLITDMELADGSDGVEVTETLRRSHPGIGVIFLAATTSSEKLRRIAGSGPDRLLRKPLRVSDLRDALAALTR
ncbi:response regulator [Tranquillimonas alkanivorans]|uniref:Response regulator receiver domain-containing protein n=1 Tax=Tranquillimonas alkanivorans TaxID=441119 RepID=A0A1I5U9H7_9RHOB|nr:response regulator [Tranquillimonas alkanivorans]SFP91286.1 Response regulator receiver domain-containing protein [Tranquillimonas alkanivorans]